MTALAPHVPVELVDRLAKVAGLLGSDHDGERSAAAFRATATIRDAGLTWGEVIRAAGPRVVEREPEQPSSGTGGRPGKEWYWNVQACLDRPERISAWERHFLSSLSGRGAAWQPSAKQLRVLGEIYAKVMAS